jgi:hypothetical protein
VLVTFESFKDREDVLKNSKVLRRGAVTVTEDLSKRCPALSPPPAWSGLGRAGRS